MIWYARHGQPALDLAARRAGAPWYRHKHAVSFADMHAALRRELLTAQLLVSPQVMPTLEQLLGLQVAHGASAA